MPVSELQARVLREIAANRSPDSYLAGATVLHRADDSPRFSQDLDLFHDLEDAVAVSADADARTLRRAGYSLTWALQTPTFHRAVVEVAGQSLKLEWAHDSAFRFFPVERDPFCGYRLHAADAAVNKMLAMGCDPKLWMVGSCSIGHGLEFDPFGKRALKVACQALAHQGRSDLEHVLRPG